LRVYHHHEAESHHHHHEAGSHHHNHHDMKHKKAGSFLRRVHRAIMALGLWEGRAVAFVLGECLPCTAKISLMFLKRLRNRCFASHVLGDVCPRISHRER
jgi:hypothetical protein